jgi:hypothetical protein
MCATPVLEDKIHAVVLVELGTHNLRMSCAVKPAILRNRADRGLDSSCADTKEDYDMGVEKGEAVVTGLRSRRLERRCNALFPLPEHAITDVFEIAMVFDVRAKFF